MTLPQLYDPTRRWQLTDVGAVQWYGMLAAVQQQQTVINALTARVAMLEYQLNTQKAVNA